MTRKCNVCGLEITEDMPQVIILSATGEAYHFPECFLARKKTKGKATGIKLSTGAEDKCIGVKLEIDGMPRDCDGCGRCG